MTLREKIARAISLGAWEYDYTPRDPKYPDVRWVEAMDAADAVLALLSDPANISDEMREIAVGVYEDQPRLSDMRVMARAIAAAFTATKESTK